jgi:hypothetical protein
MHVTGWALACSDQSEAVRSDIKGRRRRRKAHGQRELELEFELGWGHGSEGGEGCDGSGAGGQRATCKMESGG